jgi:hypothetical protein
MREVARFELQVDAGVTAEQLVQQTLRVLHDESELALQKPVLLCDGAEVTDRSGLVSRLTLAPTVARRHSRRASSHSEVLNLRLLGLLSEGWAASSSAAVSSPRAPSHFPSRTGSSSGGGGGRGRQAHAVPSFTLQITPSTLSAGGTEALPSNSSLLVCEDRVFLVHFSYSKLMISPRQARDKPRGKQHLKKRPMRFLR